MFFLILLLAVLGVWSWTARPWRGWAIVADEPEHVVHIDRFDRLLDEYVSLGSYSALQRMNTNYPQQTKHLIEDVLQLGHIEESDIEQRLRHFYLDSTVQLLLEEVHRQYADLSDIETGFARAFDEQRRLNPNFRQPHIYTQISCLRQSVIVGDTLIGISLDKYLGEDFHLYREYYTDSQRRQMCRDSIVADAMRAYLKREAHKEPKH